MGSLLRLVLECGSLEPQVSLVFLLGHAGSLCKYSIGMEFKTLILNVVARDLVIRQEALQPVGRILAAISHSGIAVR